MFGILLGEGAVLCGKRSQFRYWGRDWLRSISLWWRIIGVDSKCWRLFIHGQINLYLLDDYLYSEETVVATWLEVFKNIWQSRTPLKVLVFLWQLLHDRIPVRFNLSRQHILQPKTSRNWGFCLNNILQPEVSTTN
jgi:hypothetical protein